GQPGAGVGDLLRRRPRLRARMLFGHGAPRGRVAFRPQYDAPRQDRPDPGYPQALHGRRPADGMLGGMGDEGEPPERPWLRTFAQLEAGQSRAEISRRTKSGAYRRVLRGVYADREVSGLDRCRAVGLW